VLVAFRGPDSQSSAQVALRQIQSKAGLPEAFLEPRGENWTVAMGRYADPASKEAQEDLKRAKTARIDGQVILGGAFLAPPYSSHGQGPIGDFDLRNARQGLKPRDARYTLQVGVYARSDYAMPSPAEVAEFRKAAEEAAAKLRREGELAFFNHGPTMSIVTVGVFGDEDYDAQAFVDKSPALQQARQRFPLSLLNGKGRRVRVPGVPANSPKAWRMDPSLLVALPT
jgi:hypothetical protein